MSIVSADEALTKANSLFVDEDYTGALVQYNLAAELDANNCEVFVKRAQCHIKLKDYLVALDDANTAISLKPANPNAYLRKGIAAFYLEEFETAKQALEKGSSLGDSSMFKTWIRKCEAEVSEESAQSGAAVSSTFTSAPTSSSLSSTTASPVSSSAASSSSSSSSSAPAAASSSSSSSAAAVLPSSSKIRHEWFQTQTHVSITVFAKGAKPEDVDVDIKEHTVAIAIRLGGGSEFLLDLDLFDKVVVSESSFSVLSTKVEIKLKKAMAIKWNTLEGTGVPVGPVQSLNPAEPGKTSAAKKVKDWDRMATDLIGEEKPEGEEALNKLFKDIFGNGSDEQKRAMVKSFTESGGTVLSTNWEDVGKKKVEGTPPPGMEMHKWEELQK